MIWLYLYIGGVVASLVATAGDPFFSGRENFVYALTWPIGIPVVLLSSAESNFRKFRAASPDANREEK